MSRNKSLNIGIVTTWFERGAAYVSRAYLETLSKEHNVFIYARGGEKYAVENPYWDKDYVTWGKRNIELHPLFIYWNDFIRWINKNNLDLIIFNEQNIWDVILKCKKLNLIIGAYVDYYTDTTVPFFWLFDFLLCNTQRHYSVFNKHPQALYIPWGTNCDVFTPTNQTSNKNNVRFFHSAGMGGIGLRKGTDILVKSFQKVTGNAELIIHSQVGINKYADSAKLIGDDPRITFIEREISAPGLYYLGDVYVYPSRLEGIGLTIPEALASGLPVITTDNAPMNEFVIDHHNGYLVEVDYFRQRNDRYYWPESICSEIHLANAMQYYIDNPVEITNQGLQARIYAEENLDWNINSRIILDRIAHFKKINRNQDLIEEVMQIEYSRFSDLHYKLINEGSISGDRISVIKNFFQGLEYEKSWLRNRGIWRLLIETIIGKRVSN